LIIDAIADMPPYERFAAFAATLLMMLLLRC